MQSTRARKEKFIMSFGDHMAREAVLNMYFRHGLSVLSDEMLDEFTNDLVTDAMSSNKRTIRNRRINRRELGLI